MKKDRYILIIIMASILFRLVYIWGIKDDGMYDFQDKIHYITAAETIVEKGEFGLNPESQNHPFSIEPVYPIFLSGIFLLFGKSILAIEIIQSIIISLSGFLIFIILKQLVSRPLSYIGTIIYLLYPFYIFFGCYIGIESLYIPALVLFAYLLLMYYNSEKSSYLYFTAVLLGLMFHLRMTSIALSGVVLLCVLLVNKKRYLKSLRELTVLLIIIFLLSIPWGIRNYQVFGKITFPRNYISNYKEDSASSDVLDNSQFRFITNLQGGLGNKSFIKTVTENTCYLFSPIIIKGTEVQLDTGRTVHGPLQYISLLTVVPLLLATILLPFFKRKRYLLLLYSMILLYSIPYIIILASTRYRLPIDFVMILLLALLLDSFWSKYKPIEGKQ